MSKSKVITETEVVSLYSANRLCMTVRKCVMTALRHSPSPGLDALVENSNGGIVKPWEKDEVDDVPDSVVYLS